MSLPVRGRVLPALLAGLSLTVVAACGSGPGNSVSDASGEDFYAENDTIEIAGGHDAGSGFDFYMRAVAGAIPRVSELDTTVRNIPGGGGLIGDNDVFEATPDGQTIGLLNFPGHVFAQLTEAEGVRFDFSEWEWLGRVAAGPPVILVAADGPYQTAEDLINAEETVKFAIEEAGSDAFYGATVASETFGFPSKKITGYEGTEEVVAAVMRGEADATFLSYGSALQGVNNGDMKALMLFADEPVEPLPDVPLATELVESTEDQEALSAFGNIYNLERVFVAPPETPEDRVEYLRELLAEAFADEEFVAEVEDAGRPVDPMSGEEVAAAVEKVAEEADTLKTMLD
jgi:tripartite-type tricarboxylate transporter receptor subunit TctC